MNEQDLDGLTDEERAALAEDDGSGGQTTTTENDDATGGEDEAGDAGNADDAAGHDNNAGAAAGTADDGQAGVEGAAADEPASAPAPAPILVAEAPADADAKLAEIAEKKANLLTQFDDGDITAKEYQTQLDALLKDERKIELDLHKAQLAQEMEQQRQQNEWVSTVNTFLDANKQYKDNPRLYRALDAEVRDVAKTEEARNMTGAQILAKAHANLAEAFGMAAPKADDRKGDSRKPGSKKPDLPPSLHNVPAATGQDIGEGRFAALERLAQSDPLAYEEALAKMPETERNAYLASA